VTASDHAPDEIPDELLRELMAAESELGQLARALFPDDDAELAHLSWPDRDAAAQREADATPEARLRAAEARFRSLVEQIPAVTFMAVLGQGKNEVYVSPHIEQLLGYTQEEWLEDPFLWYLRLHPEDRTLWNAEFARGCRTGGPFKAECRFMARDGHTVWVHGEARIVKDDLGRPMFLQGVAFDITESKRAQQIVLTEAVRSAKVAEELEIARRVQTSLVPKRFRVEKLEIAAAMVPAEEVGGDYYDVHAFPGGAFITIGDVSGHGLNAGLVMMMLQSALAGIVRARRAAQPRDVLLYLNDVLFDNVRVRLGQRDHVTLSVLRYTVDGRVRIAGAHEDVFIYRAATKSIERHRPRGAWIAARLDIAAVTEEDELRLGDGDVVVLYTDGVTEAMNASHDQFDIDRLEQVIQAHAGGPPAALVDDILQAVRDFRGAAVQEDDVSLLVMRYANPTGPGG
jgi:PAS domain S-box-containing protein